MSVERKRHPNIDYARMGEIIMETLHRQRWMESAIHKMASARGQKQERKRHPNIDYAKEQIVNILQGRKPESMYKSSILALVQDVPTKDHKRTAFEELVQEGKVTSRPPQTGTYPRWTVPE